MQIDELDNQLETETKHEVLDFKDIKIKKLERKIENLEKTIQDLETRLEEIEWRFE